MVGNPPVVFCLKVSWLSFPFPVSFLFAPDHVWLSIVYAALLLVSRTPVRKKSKKEIVADSFFHAHVAATEGTATTAATTAAMGPL
jgi:hypothetical protein